MNIQYFGELVLYHDYPKIFLLEQVNTFTYISSIPLASVGKYNSFGRHVDTDTKGLGGK